MITVLMDLLQKSLNKLALHRKSQHHNHLFQVTLNEKEGGFPPLVYLLKKDSSISSPLMVWDCPSTPQGAEDYLLSAI